MLISTEWIKDFVKLPELSPEELSQRVTMHLAPVERTTVFGEHLSRVRVALVRSIRPHPSADHLKLVTFDWGSSELKEVVCGAPNVRLKMKAAYAPVGTVFPNGLTLEAKPIRGIISEGMLCSEAELGLGDADQGIYELSEDAAVGVTLLQYLNEREDVVIDIENVALTHRPDLWGHFGMAREFSAIFRARLEDRFDSKWVQKIEKRFGDQDSPVTVKVSSGTACLGYHGIALDNITVEPSPLWMQQRLRRVGLRPINNMVDVGNYVMLELGIPLHIFDREKIGGSQIIVRQARAGEKLTMLDGSVAELTPADTVVADAKRPLVVGGIMGGVDSGVSDSTRSIFIETANWAPAAIRRTSQRLGIRTDSSLRYEKSLDSHLLMRNLLRAVELVLELCAGAEVVGERVYDGPKLVPYKPITIELDRARLDQLLGAPSEPEEVERALTALDFGVKSKRNKYLVSVPSYRSTKDIAIDVDLVEEIGRILGYERIETVAPLTRAQHLPLNTIRVLHRKIEDHLVLKSRALQVMTYPLVSQELLDKYSWNDFNEPLKLVNALSSYQDRPRPSLVPSIIEICDLNQKHYPAFRLFEIGRAYHPDQKSFSTEESQLILAYFDRDNSTYINTLESVESLLAYIGCPGGIREPNPKFPSPTLPLNWSGAHPEQQLDIFAFGQAVGSVVAIHPLFLSEIKIRGHLTLAAINLGKIEATAAKDSRKFTELPKFPSSELDFTIVVPARTSVGDSLAILGKQKIRELIAVKIVSTYQLADGSSAVTLRTTFQDPEKTLSGEFIKAIESKIVASLRDAGFPLREGSGAPSS